MEEEWETELKTGFLEEASQSIADNEKNFLLLEKEPQNGELVDSIFRLAHNLKGSAKAVGFSELGAFTHEFESVLLKIRNKELAPDPAVVNVLLLCNDHVKLFVDSLKADHSAQIQSAGLVTEIRNVLAGKPAGAPESVAAVSAPESAPALPPDAPAEAAFAEEIPAPAVPSPEAPAKEKFKAAAKPDESIRVSLGRIELLLNCVGELVILEDVLKQQVSAMQAAEPLRKTVHQINKVTKDIQNISMSLRMTPLQSTFQKMQRIVRDTASALGKDVEFEIKGEDTEVDKSVLESLSDPLVHVIRNAVDHGIESAEIRLASGKESRGKVRLQAYHRAGQLFIEVEDNGAGLDPVRLKAKAVEKGILKASDPITDQEAIHLIFHPGFSTKQEVTEVSGRGVGMDVVKTNITRLGGEVMIDSVVGRGSIFQIKLPLTLAIADAMVVLLSQQRFVIPLSQVHESLRLTKKDVHQATGGEVLLFRAENLPLFRLGGLLGQAHPLDFNKNPIGLVFRNGGKPFAVLVDDVIGQQPIVMKELSDGMGFSRGFAGTTILGDGKAALILEVSELVNAYGKRSFSVGQTRGAA